jgi:AraC-like DNA-binding protein
LSSAAAAAQSYREYAPPPALAPYVTCFWVQQVAVDGPAYPHLTVPSGSVEIACTLESSAVQVVGPQTKPRRGLLGPGRTDIGVRFRPGAARSILSLPASEIVDDRVDLADCWRSRASELGAVLAEARSPTQALVSLGRELVRRIGSEPTFELHVGEFLQPWHRRRVETVSRELFLSERQFRRRCIAAFGHGPKELQRVLRFQAFLALAQGRRWDELELARLALVVGYADQPHLSRECLRLTGLTPTRFLAELSASCGSSHDHTPSFSHARRRMSDSFKNTAP